MLGGYHGAPRGTIRRFREYWIVNVAETVIDVYRAPGAGAYASVTRHAAGEVLRPEASPDVVVNVADVFA